LLTTPNTQDFRDTPDELRPSRIATGRKTDYLSRQIGMLRTPDAHMERGPRSPENLHDRYVVRKMPLCLNDQLAMLPTPKGRDWKGETRRGPENPGDGLQNTLSAVSGISKQDRGEKNGLRLQPNFVEWMQGFPIGWTDLKA
jgi:hypothetical protein